MKTKIIALSFSSCIALLLSSCYYDNLKELKPEAAISVGNCDTTAAISYSAQIAPILSSNCVSCHGAGGSFPNLTNYADVNSSKAIVYSSVTWDGSVSNMPKSSTTKIETCSISQIRLWIAQGAPNN